MKSFMSFQSFQNEKGFAITCMRSDHGREFKNIDFEEYCNEHGINHNFSTPKTPQQNGTVERKNKTLQEMTRIMLNEHNLPKYFWVEAVNTSCYVLNRILLRPILNKLSMSFGKTRNPILIISKSLGANVLYWTPKTILENLMQNQMLEFSLVTQLQVKPLEFLTKEPWL